MKRLVQLKTSESMRTTNEGRKMQMELGITLLHEMRPVRIFVVLAIKYSPNFPTATIQK
jgi:hypothetical protein